MMFGKSLPKVRLRIDIDILVYKGKLLKVWQFELNGRLSG